MQVKPDPYSAISGVGKGEGVVHIKNNNSYTPKRVLDRRAVNLQGAIVPCELP